MKNRLTTQVILALLCLSGAGLLAADASPKPANWYQLIDGRHCVSSVSPTVWALKLEWLGGPPRLSNSKPGDPVLVVNGSHPGADVRAFFSEESQCQSFLARLDATLAIEDLASSE